MKRWFDPLIVLASFAYLMGQWFYRFDDGYWRLRHTIGLLVLLPSFVLWTAARFQLGDAFTWRAEARRLETRGLYSRIRNPIYLFAEMAGIGFLVFLGRPLFFLALLISVPIQVRRARKEARVLEAAFGDEYRAYKARTWF